MTTTVLAAGQTAAASSVITVGEGERVTVGIFAGSGAIPYPVALNVRINSPGSDEIVAVLNRANNTTVLSGPGSFVVRRPDITAFGVNVGAFTNP